MTELEKIERAKMYMDKLANGINPIDDSARIIKFHLAISETVLGIGQDAMLLGTGNRHIEQTTLLFQLPDRNRSKRTREDILL